MPDCVYRQTEYACQPYCFPWNYKMTKQHEILAVEAEKEGVARKIIAESEGNFGSKHNLFMGMVKTLSMEETDQKLVEEAGYEVREIHTTVEDRLDYTWESITEWFDVVLTKETTNQIAKADIVIDGTVLASDVPVGFLLGLETKLAKLRGMYGKIPTLPPGQPWVRSPEDGEHIYVLGVPEIRIKTAKRIQSKTLAPATDKHPAQVEHWNEDVPVGKFSTNYTMGMVTSARKHDLLARLDALIQAVKQARMRANNTDIVESNIGETIFKFLHK